MDLFFNLGNRLGGKLDGFEEFQMVLVGFRSFRSLKSFKGLKGLKGFKRLKRLKGLKGLKSLKDFCQRKGSIG